MKKSAAKTEKPRQRFHFKRMQIVMVLFGLLTLVLCMVQMGLFYEPKDGTLELLDSETLAAAGSLEQTPSCLLLWQDDLQGRAVRDLMEDVLEQMRVPCRSQAAKPIHASALRGYDTVVLAVSDLSVLKESVLELMDWTDGGGKLMLACMPSQNGYLDMIAGRIGIASVGTRYLDIGEIRCAASFMPGGDDDFFLTGRYEASMQVQLREESQVYVSSEETWPIPLVWRWEEGQGTVVVMNLGYTTKSFRGFYAAAYSLLGDAFAWPVINGAAFFLDDFPAPQPYGDDTRLQEDYGMGYRDFLTQIWWIDVQELARNYGVRYTGALIETYSDKTKAPLSPNRDLSRFQYFGRSLLDIGGEIALHGYSHMPLVLEDFDYRGGYDAYAAWGNTEDMRSSLAELMRFGKELFPAEQFQVYVPPSNILSQQARAMIAEEFPQIRAVAGTFLEGGVSYAQEFEVADDGVVELPRVVEGCEMDDMERLTALSELTLHYVSTHSQRPDDALDDSDGNSLGWEEMKRGLEDYMDWLYTAAPSIRSLTASELAAAVQRYDVLTVSQTVEEDALKLELGGLQDEAWLLVRLNGCRPGAVEGGSLEMVQEGLYLLEAKSSHIRIALD